MKSGYKIRWTPNALEELDQTMDYLESNFNDKVIVGLALKIESIVKLISENPELFQESETKNVRRVVILKFNTLYYRVKNDEIEILSFFSNRQNPDKRKIFPTDFR